MSEQKTFLVFGATGQTGQHFVRRVLREGHRVRASARTPSKLVSTDPNLTVHQGTVPDVPQLDELLEGVDYVVAMLGDTALQETSRINSAFVQKLVPAMRRQGVTRFLYQAGGLSKPPTEQLSPVLWAIRNTVARGYRGQHEDNEAVMSYLLENASDLEWMVHRAGIRGDGPSKGVLQRSDSAFSVATFIDCADYTYRTVMDAAAVHSCDLSRYRKG